MKALLMICAIGALTDYVITMWGITHGGIEQNPLLVFLIARFGIGVLLPTKVVGIFAVCLAVWLVDKNNKWATKLFGDPSAAECRFMFGLMFFTTLVQWLMVANNLWQMKITLALGEPFLGG